MLHKNTETIIIKKIEKSCNSPYMILKLIQKEKRYASTWFKNKNNKINCILKYIID